MIEVVLENCEVLKFADSECSVVLDNLCRHYFGKRLDFNGAKDVLLTINLCAEPERDPDWQTQDWRERLKGNDITQIWVDGQCYYVDWNDEDEWTNRNQTTTVDNRNIYCVISRTKKRPEDFE